MDVTGVENHPQRSPHDSRRLLERTSGSLPAKFETWTSDSKARTGSEPGVYDRATCERVSAHVAQSYRTDVAIGAGGHVHPDAFANKAAIEAWLGRDAVSTIGWVIEKGHHLFEFDDNLVEKLLQHGHQGGPVKIHAWLTLPTMEIIDLTLAATTAVLRKQPRLEGSVIASRVDQLHGLIYKPILVGTEFIRRTGLVRFVLRA
jgi:hypothetical protein